MRDSRKTDKQLGVGPYCNPYFGQMLPENFPGDTITKFLASATVSPPRPGGGVRGGDTQGSTHIHDLPSCSSALPLGSLWGKQ